MDKLDTLVTTHLADRLLHPERLSAVLASLASRRAAKATAVSERLGVLEKEAHDANERLRRLYKLVEDGVAEMDHVLKDRITALKADRDRVQAALDRARSGVRPAVDISPIVVERFGRTMREKLTTGDVPFRKAYLGSVVDRVEVDDREVRIIGRKDVLEQAVLANGGPFPAFAVLLANGAPYGRARAPKIFSLLQLLSSPINAPLIPPHDTTSRGRRGLSAVAC
jgi:hypothetical protein